MAQPAGAVQRCGGGGRQGGPLRRRAVESLAILAHAYGLSARQATLVHALVGTGALRSAAALVKQYAWEFPAFRRPEGMTNPMAMDLGTLSEDELARLDLVSAQPLQYPYWHHANTSSDRLSPADLSLLGRHIG